MHDSDPTATKLVPSLAQPIAIRKLPANVVRSGCDDEQKFTSCAVGSLVDTTTPHMLIFLQAKVPIVSSARLRSRSCELHTASYKLGKVEETTANMQHNALPAYVLFVSTPVLDVIKCLASLETPFLFQ